MSKAAFNRGIPAMWMRGGTSKGGFFLAEDLPGELESRDVFLLCVMGSPDRKQIDGLGGANPLTSKVAVVKKSTRKGIDVDYLFLQVFVDEAIVTDRQNCGNMLAGVGPFAIERGLVHAQNGETKVTIYMENTNQIAEATIQTPKRVVTYEGSASIDGVPGTAAAIPLMFRDTAGSSCGALLPTGNTVDQIAGIDVTLIDNGMPCVIIRADDLDVTGYESPEILEANINLKTRLEEIRLAAGPLMNLGDVQADSVPKMTIVAPPKNGGAISTRTFIPHRCHDSIGVLGGVTVATACLLPGSIANGLAVIPAGTPKTVTVEHPSGVTECLVSLTPQGEVDRTEILRTARKLFDGIVFA
jgi:4-oxalomesaconate tautomerase